MNANGSRWETELQLLNLERDRFRSLVTRLQSFDLSTTSTDPEVRRLVTRRAVDRVEILQELGAVAFAVGKAITATNKAFTKRLVNANRQKNRDDPNAGDEVCVGRRFGMDIDDCQDELRLVALESTRAPTPLSFANLSTVITVLIANPAVPLASIPQLIGVDSSGWRSSGLWWILFLSVPLISVSSRRLS